MELVQTYKVLTFSLVPSKPALSLNERMMNIQTLVSMLLGLELSPTIELHLARAAANVSKPASLRSSSGGPRY